MKTLCIGDIHGCWTELEALLDKASLSADDRIVALGDFVDRGPDSGRVLNFLAGEAQAMALMGNHERKHLRASRGELKPALSQQITRQQLGETAYAEALAFMTTLPLFMASPEALLVHGFFEPGIPLEQQRDTVLAGTLSGDFYLQKQYARPWYELYDGDRPIVAGHHDYLGTGQPLIWADRVWCIDTGCCRGNALTGLLLPEFKVISVKSRMDYWSETCRRFAT